ncbi:MAG: hypothetical protein KatS3mg032_0486 [Cyclobacteriaceae bacterium]|nr:MAG: hypothetical protein KatS3mg032_0486 [Cyclobacteriaceae bacterium]
MRKVIAFILLAFTGGTAGAWFYGKYILLPEVRRSNESHFTPAAYDSPVSYENPRPAEEPSANDVSVTDSDFSLAASRAIPSVVYINSIFKGASYSPFDWFFRRNHLANTGKQRFGSNFHHRWLHCYQQPCC